MATNRLERRLNTLKQNTTSLYNSSSTEWKNHQKRISDVEATLLKRAVENNSNRDYYVPIKDGYEVVNNRKAATLTERSRTTRYHIEGSKVSVTVENHRFDGISQKGTRTQTKNFDTPAQAVAYVDRQIKRAGKNANFSVLSSESRKQIFEARKKKK